MRYSERALYFTAIQGKTQYHKCIYVVRKGRSDCVSWSTSETPIIHWWLMLSLPIQNPQSLVLAVYIFPTPCVLHPIDFFQRIVLENLESTPSPCFLLSALSQQWGSRSQKPLLSLSRNILTLCHVPPPSILWMTMSRALTCTLLLLGSLTPLPVGFY